MSFSRFLEKDTVQGCFIKRGLEFANDDRKRHKYIWQTESSRFATDGRMSAVFLAVMLVCAKPIFAADEDITSLVMEGCFRAKCEEMVSFTYKYKVRS